MKQLSRIPNVSVRFLPLCSTWPPPISQPLSQRESEREVNEGLISSLLSVGSSQVLSDGSMGRWGSSRGSGRRGKKEWWIKQRKASLFLTGSRRERRGGTTDYLMMEERGWWWEPDTCGGVFREGSLQERRWPSVAVTGNGDGSHEEPSTQSKNVNGCAMDAYQTHICTRSCIRLLTVHTWPDVCCTSLISIITQGRFALLSM